MLQPDSTSPQKMRCGCCFLAFLALLALVTPAHADECETYRFAVETARAAHAAANIALESAVEAHVDATIEAALDAKSRSINERETEVSAARNARSALHVAFTALKSALDAAGNDHVALKSARQAVYEAARATSRVASLEATYDAAIETAVRDSIKRGNDTFITIMVEIDDDHARERALEDSIAANFTLLQTDVETAYNNFYANIAKSADNALSAIEAALTAIETAATCLQTIPQPTDHSDLPELAHWISSDSVDT